MEQQQQQQQQQAVDDLNENENENGGTIKYSTLPATTTMTNATTTTTVVPTTTDDTATTTTAASTATTNSTNVGLVVDHHYRRGGGVQNYNNDDSKELPNNVETMEQLQTLPAICKTKSPHRPLRHVDDDSGQREFTYLLQPMQTVIWIILIVEFLERFSFYGVYYTQTLYLTGVYNGNWNAGLTSVQAASYVSLSTSIAYTTPFIGAIFADRYLGDYLSIICGTVGLYLPGLTLVALTTIPSIWGGDSGGDDDEQQDDDDEQNNHASYFPTRALSIALLVLWPLGTGTIKSIINVFGARQFHPLLQSAMIESYYVHFYTSINAGALLGITTIPILAQTQGVTIAYFIPVVCLTIGMILFVSYTPEYVIHGPPPSKQKHTTLSTIKTATATTTATGTTNTDDDPSTIIPLTTVWRISLLIVPFCIAYSQMPTTFIVQGTVMQKAFGIIDAATMNGLDALSVLIFGSIMAHSVYPYLSNRQIKIPTSYKFAMGSFFGAMSILWAMYIEHKIHATYPQTVSILWQAPSYILIGCGEILAVSSAYEAAFSCSSPSTKALASAINIFCVGGIPNILCIGLYRAGRGWFRNTTRGDTDITDLDDYVTAHVSRYFAALVVILLVGVGLNVHPRVRDFVKSVEKQSSDLLRTPRQKRTAAVETTPLLRKKFGTQPVLYKMGSMRAGPSLSQHTQLDERVQRQHPKVSNIARMYNTSHTNKRPDEEFSSSQEQAGEEHHRFLLKPKDWKHESM